MNFIQSHTEYIDRLQLSLSKVVDLELAKQRLTYARWKVAENLDKLLFEFETNVKKNDANILWCPDDKSTIQNLNMHLKGHSKVDFLNHTAVNHVVRSLKIDRPEITDQPDLVVAGAKFIVANTGNFFIAFNDLMSYEKALGAKKLVVIAGIDSVLSQQKELYTARQLYSIFETGNLSYTAEILGRPGRARGVQAEVVLLLVDLNKNKLLEIPELRPLFSMLNFDFPPICSMEQFSEGYGTESYLNSLDVIFDAFLNNIKEHPDSLFENYGFRNLNSYLPYDIDLYEHILMSRAMLKDEKKSSGLFNIFNANNTSTLLNPKRFKDQEKFRRFAEKKIFGPF
jgi:hypothetical protein